MTPKILILVDGTCIFCNRLVAFILRRDANKLFCFAHLQSQTALEVLARHALEPDIDAIYAVTGYGEQTEHVWLDGEAGRQIYPRLFRIAALLRLVPLVVLNLQYRMFARVRYRLFGQTAECIVPDADERERFLP